MATADLILKNGKIFSVKDDNTIIRGEAVIIKDGKIDNICGNDEALKYEGNNTEVIDCGGNTILPGLCDAHCHPSIAAAVYAGCDLFGIYIQENETPDEVIDKYLARLKDFVDSHPDNALIRGTGWVQGNFITDRKPARQDLDRICSDRPVILESFCQHSLWVNTKALEIAGIDKDTPDVYAGEIVRDEQGNPTGYFKEPEAMDLIKMNVPGYDFSVEEYKDAFLFYQSDFANKYGVTLVQDCMHSDNAREAYVQLAKEGKLTVRARGVYMLEPGAFGEQLPQFINRKGSDDVGKDFRIDTIKIFAEGMFVLKEPFTEEFISENGMPKGYRGTPYWNDEDLGKSIEDSMKAGFDVHIHAMGDASVHQAAKCIRAAQDNTGIKKRNVIAHLMLVDDESYENMEKADIIANCQPRWMVYDSDIAGMFPLIGEERSLKAYPLREFLDRKITVAFGTDFPVTPPPDTMHEVQCAMTRSVFPDAPDYEKFKGKILGDEKPAELAEAIKSLSINGAYQMNLEDITGSIEVGKSADLVILDSNLEDAPVDDIYSIAVEKTIFKGRVVYNR